jgi:hypothetical protein
MIASLPQFEIENGMCRQGDFRFLKHGTKKLFLDRPLHKLVGCQCVNPTKWSNMLDVLTKGERLLLSLCAEEVTEVFCAKCAFVALATWRIIRKDMKWREKS